VLADLTVDELAARIDADAGMSVRTIRKYEGGETKLREPALRTLAAALELPYSWFTVRSISEQFEGTPEFNDRLQRLEARLEAGHGPVPASSNSADAAQPSPEGSQPSVRRRGPRGTRQVRGS
jgi:transcriptional regulator with XRE-family HTH domain